MYEARRDEIDNEVKQFEAACKRQFVQRVRLRIALVFGWCCCPGPLPHRASLARWRLKTTASKKAKLVLLPSGLRSRRSTPRRLKPWTRPRRCGAMGPPPWGSWALMKGLG